MKFKSILMKCRQNATHRYRIFEFIYTAGDFGMKTISKNLFIAALAASFLISMPSYANNRHIVTGPAPIQPGPLLPPRVPVVPGPVFPGPSPVLPVHPILPPPLDPVDPVHPILPPPLDPVDPVHPILPPPLDPVDPVFPIGQTGGPNVGSQ
jgi:hypothetical protein